jgi:hypothetical protein
MDGSPFKIDLLTGHEPGESLGGFQSRRDCDPKPRVARNELPWVESGILTNPNGVAPNRRNPVGVVNSRKLAPGAG